MTGQKVVIWNAASGSVVEEDAHLGTQPLAAYLGGALFFEHQDWLGTERLLTDGAGHRPGRISRCPSATGSRTRARTWTRTTSQCTCQ